MRNRKLKVNLKVIDMEVINKDYFGEALINCVLNTKKNIEHVKDQISRISLSFVPYDHIMNCYDAIIDKVILRNQLTKLFELFKDWYRNLDDKRKKLFVTYFVKRDKIGCVRMTKNTHYFNKYILLIVRSFMGYVKTISDLNEETLIKNPYVYNSYIRLIIERERPNKKYV